MELRNEEINEKRIIAVKDATYAVTKREPANIFNVFISQLRNLMGVVYYVGN